MIETIVKLLDIITKDADEFFYCKNCRYPYGDGFSGRKEEIDFNVLNKDTFEMRLPCEGGAGCKRQTIFTCKIIKVELGSYWEQDKEQRIDISNKSDEEIKKEGDKLQDEWFKKEGLK